MEICTLASSSLGNCTLISAGGGHILIDAGISFKRVRESLAALGIDACDLSAVLVTHTHGDHVRGLEVLTKRLHTHVFIGAGAGDEIHRAVNGCAAVTRVTPGEDVRVGAVTVRAFRTMHDSAGSVGYRVSDGARSAVFVTDLGKVTPEVVEGARGADIAVIEANHDIKMLKYGPYPPPLKRRVASDYGHLSNEASGAFAAALLRSGTRKFILAHLSEENNSPQLARRTVENALRRAGAEPGGEVEVGIAPRDGVGRLYIV